MHHLEKSSKIRRHHLLLIWAILFASAPCFAQKLVKKYVTEKNTPIATIEPDSTNYSDLEVIGNAIGDAKVVMLGEQDHGDAPTFLAKTRLIKYLHEKKGFNVLAFESDFFGLNDGWDKLNKQHSDIDTFILKNIFPIWTVCKSCDNLFYKYVPSTWSTTQPLIITGFDSQQYLNYSFYHLKGRLDSIFRKLNLPVTRQENYAPEMLPLIDSPRRWIFAAPKDTIKLHKCLDYLTSAKKQLAAVVDSNSFWLLVMDNLIQQAKAVRTEFITGKPAIFERDIQMAKNLKWLNENKFKNQKIVVWAADAHIVKSLKNMKEAFFDKQPTLGDSFVTNLKNNDKVYILGFTSYRGTAGRLGFKHYKLYPPRNNGFENWINKDYPYAFVDFDEFNKIYPDAGEYFYMTALGHFNYEGKWNQLFDGVFFIRDMYPCAANR